MWPSTTSTNLNSFSSSNWITLVSQVPKCSPVPLPYRCTNGVHLEVELENHLNALEETSVIQLELGKEFGGTGTGLHLEVEPEKVFQLLWSLLYVQNYS